MKVVRAMNPEMEVVSGSNNCKGEWKNECPYMVCECAKRELTSMKDGRREYKIPYEALIFWSILIIAIAAVIINLYFL
jgi:hypothetical protein